MRDLLPPELLQALKERLSKHLPDDADADSRRLAYAALRREVADNKFGTSSGRGYETRLAAEYVINDAEQASGDSKKDINAALDPWSLLDPTSPDYVLSDKRPAAAIFPTTRRNRIYPMSGLRACSQRLAVILSLWLHSLNREASQDRIGYVWLVLDPLIQIMVVCAVPLLIQPKIIFDMAVFPFSVIGACFWLVFRTAVISSMTGGGVLKSQLEHPSIRRFDIMVARAFNGLITYFFAALILLGFSIFIGLTDGPQHFPFLIGLFLTSWIMGISFGVIANSIIGLYPGVRRVIVYGLRFIALTSGLFYVPEQLPERVAEVILYNPLLQIIQLARTHWFFEYTTMDASLPYIFFWAISLVLLALVCLVIDESRLDTVRA